MEEEDDAPAPMTPNTGWGTLRRIKLIRTRAGPADSTGEGLKENYALMNLTGRKGEGGIGSRPRWISSG